MIVLTLSQKKQNERAMKAKGWTWKTSWPVLVLWVSVTLAVSLTSLSAFLTPVWYVRDTVRTSNSWKKPIITASFGIWTWCLGWDNPDCSFIGKDILGRESATPSTVWAMAGTLYGGGGLLLAITGVICSTAPFLSSNGIRLSFTRAMSNIQATSVVLQALGLILYPLGLGSPFSRNICGPEATLYFAANCHLGYGYMLALVSTTLSVYCPVLARLSVYKKYSNDSWDLNHL